MPSQYLKTLLFVCLASGPGPLLAWGAEGHSTVGVMALEQVSPETRLALGDILGSMEPEAIAAACNWPDEYDSSDAGQWSSPLHFVNIPPESDRYKASRDCTGRQCVTAAIIDYAGELGDNGLSRNARQQAFAFLCHFTADIHQPLHVGYSDDAGGSLVTVSYRGEELDLHELWDTRLIDHRASDWQQLVQLLNERPDRQSHPHWQAGEVTAWTNESFALTRHFVYPLQRQVDSEWDEQAWRVVQHQLATAAGRLAGILDVVLAKD